jgi:NAD(P)-dependent dehydrogenase (short-subunit alcohol dehydrogenase family)
MTTTLKESFMTSWTFDDIPDQTGRTAIVTGANTGIGYEAALMLAQQGARVVLACRNAEKGEAAVQRIRAEQPKGSVTFAPLDLSDLDSVAAFVSAFEAGSDRLDLLVNNAGVMVPPLGRTKQGFELQMGTNHLGHFALTGRLLPLLQRTPGSRVVVVSSTGQNIGKIDFDDLNWQQRSYSRWSAYGQSKLANMMFVLELQRRLAASGSDVRVTAAHPGWTATDLSRTAGGMTRFLNPLIGMKPHDGALPTLRAATDPAAAGGSYWGPAHFFEMNGPPVPARVAKRAKDAAVAERLWNVSEELTGVSYAA